MSRGIQMPSFVFFPRSPETSRVVLKPLDPLPGIEPAPPTWSMKAPSGTLGNEGCLPVFWFICKHSRVAKNLTCDLLR